MIAATQQTGAADACAHIQAITLAVPDALASPTVSTTGHTGELAVLWQPPSPLPGVILFYDVAVTDAALGLVNHIVYSGLRTSVVVAAPVSSLVRVRASTIAGTGPYSAAASAPAPAAAATDAARQPYVIAPVAGACAVLVVLLVVFARLHRRQQQVLAGSAFVRPAPDEWELDPADVHTGARLGAGNFGIVVRATVLNVRPDLPGTTTAAVKVLAQDASVTDMTAFVAEADLMKKFARPWHENVRGCGCDALCPDARSQVVRLYGACLQGARLMIVMELVPRGDLHAFLSDCRGTPSTGVLLSVRQLGKMALDIASGMLFLSSKRFVHRDLAARCECDDSVRGC